ncbi:MAG: nucleoside recognition domain-containing protein [Myxococcota bacterium]
MMNYIWMGIILISFVSAAVMGRMEATTKAMIDSAKDAVELAIGLVGLMAFWLGVMRVAQDGGLLDRIARAIKPLMARLFPDVPSEHPAMSAMIMNIAANILGLANAATPFGIKAMMELNKLNTRKGVATNAMCLFLAINTSNVTLLPMGVIAVRAAAGSEKAAAIVGSTLFATFCSTLVAIVAAKLLVRLPIFSLDKYSATEAAAEEAKSGETGDKEQR